MRNKRLSREGRREALTGFLFASPWLVGFLVFGLVPILLSMYYSLCRYDVLRPPMFIGLENYRYLFTESSTFYKSIYNTLYYTVFRVPLVVLGSLLLAMLVERQRPGVNVVRTIYYLPSIVSGVALSVIWLWMYNPQHGLVNEGLRAIGIATPPLWLESETWSKPAMILMGLWSIGGGRMIVFIAGLNGIPRHLYESAEIDGAGWWVRFRHITIPQISSILFLLTITEIITSFQVFTEAYIMTNGGPVDSTLFYNLELYNKAFLDYEMGLASALAWILFVGTLLVTLFLFKVVGSRVYYEAAKPE
ncbi:MAG: sugar ABC transporter permease [Candidatus Omnitrophica bacterium]|nr:sugar ABC transporter permease [Candidatus Omnitrophota bacterium]